MPKVRNERIPALEYWLYAQMPRVRDGLEIMTINPGDKIRLTRDIFRCKAGDKGTFKEMTPGNFASITMDDGVRLCLSSPEDVEVIRGTPC